MKILPIILASALALSARTFHASPTGNANNPGTVTQPWTLTKAGATAVAGDTVQIHGGTYKEPLAIWKSGTQASPIVFKSSPGEKPVIDGLGVARPTGNWSTDLVGMVFIQAQQYIKIQGLRVINSSWAGIQGFGSSHLVIDSCSTYNTYFSGISMMGAGAPISDIKVTRSTIEKANNSSPSGIYVNEALTLSDVDGFEVAYNLVDGTYAEGIDTKGAVRNGTVHHNEVRNAKMGIYVDSWDKTAQDIQVYANRVHHNGTGMVVSCEWGGTAKRITLHNNLVYANTQGPGMMVSDFVSGYSHYMEDITLINNTVVGNGKTWWGSGILVANKEAIRVVVRNNLVANNVDAQIAVSQSGAGLVIENNLVWGEAKVNPNAGINVVSADPQFINASAFDFHIPSTSPAANKGSSLFAPAFDFDGKPRPSGSAFDLGAFEYQAAPPVVPPTAITPPSTVSSTVTKSQVMGWMNSVKNNGQIISGIFDETYTDRAKVLTQYGKEAGSWGRGMGCGTDGQFIFSDADVKGVVDQWNKGGLTLIHPTSFCGHDASWKVWQVDTTSPEKVQWKATAERKRWQGLIDGFKKLKAAGVVFMFRPYVEMNGSHNWYGDFTNSEFEKEKVSFKNMWIQMKTMFDAQGLDNIIWVWAPMESNRPMETSPGVWQYFSANNWYPGNDYVDMIAPTWYEQSYHQGKFDLYDWSVTTGKLIGLSEAGVRSGSVCGAWREPPGDWKLSINSIKANNPNVMFIQTWDSWWGLRKNEYVQNSMYCGTNGALVSEWHEVGNLNGDAFLNHPSMLTLEEMKFSSFATTITAPTASVIAAGTYKLTTLANGKVMEVALASTLDGGNVQAGTWNSANSQQWKIEPVAGGYYKIIALHSGKALDVSEFSSANGANIHQWSYLGNANQLWMFIKQSDGSYKIMNKFSGKMVNLEVGTSNILQWESNTGTNQRWTLTLIPPPSTTGFIDNGVYYLTNILSSKAASVENEFTTNGANIHQWSLLNRPSQQWKLEPAGNGYYFIRNIYTDKVMDVSGYSTINGANVHQWSKTGADNQLWKIEKLTNGTFKITSKLSNKVLEVGAFSTSDGGNIQQWDWVNGQSQCWKLTYVTTLAKAVSPRQVTKVPEGQKSNAIKVWDLLGRVNSSGFVAKLGK